MPDAIHGARATRAQVALRYLAFQTPGWLVAATVLLMAVEFFGVERGLALALFALYVAKDAVLFPFVRHAYDPSTIAPKPVGESGVVEEALDPEGWVRVGAELWRARVARGAPLLASGMRVRIVGVRGLVLDVVEDDVVTLTAADSRD